MQTGLPGRGSGGSASPPHPTSSSLQARPCPAACGGPDPAGCSRAPQHSLIHSGPQGLGAPMGFLITPGPWSQPVGAPMVSTPQSPPSKPVCFWRRRGLPRRSQQLPKVWDNPQRTSQHPNSIQSAPQRYPANPNGPWPIPTSCQSAPQRPPANPQRPPSQCPTLPCQPLVTPGQPPTDLNDPTFES